MHSSYVLPRCQTSRYTLKRPQSATVRPLVGHNRFLAAVASSAEHEYPGRLGRPLSALQNSFVTWNQQPFDDFVEGDDDGNVEYVVERPGSATDLAPPQQDVLRPPDTSNDDIRQALFSQPAKPPVVGDCTHGEDATPHATAPDRGSNALCGTSSIVEEKSTVEASTTPDEQAIPARGIADGIDRCWFVGTAAEGTLRSDGAGTHGAGGPSTPTDSVDPSIASPSRKVAGLRDATSQARQRQDDSDRTPRDVAKQTHCCADPTGLEPTPFVSHVDVSDDVPPNIFAMDVRSTFADFVERDKYFEGVWKVLLEQEFRERLEHSMLQTARRNGLYVAMTKVYLRWAETGLNPDDPDPISHAEMEVLALRQLQHRRNIDNVVLIEERERRNLTSTLLECLQCSYGCVYAALEEEAVRTHVVRVYEPERWACIVQHIEAFLSTRLVCAVDVFKQWSLTGGDIEREESCLRQDLYRRCEVRSRHAKKAKLEVSETSARDVLERDERTKYQALMYAASLRGDRPSDGAPVAENDAVNGVAQDGEPILERADPEHPVPTDVDSTRQQRLDGVAYEPSTQSPSLMGDNALSPSADAEEPLVEQHLTEGNAVETKAPHETEAAIGEHDLQVPASENHDDDDGGGVMIVPTIAIDSASTSAAGSPRNASTSESAPTVAAVGGPDAVPDGQDNAPFPHPEPVTVEMAPSVGEGPNALMEDHADVPPSQERDVVHSVAGTTP